MSVKAKLDKGEEAAVGAYIHSVLEAEGSFVDESDGDR